MVEIVKCSKMQAWIQRACLGAQRTQSTKSRGPKGLNLEFGAQRAQRFLVFNMGLNWVNSTFPLCFTWKSYILHWRADGRLAPGQSPSGHSACQPFSRGQSACQTFSRGHSAFWHSDYSHSAFRHPARPSLNSPHMYIRNPHIYIFNFVHIDKIIATGELYNPPQPPASTCSLVHPFVSPPPPTPKHTVPWHPPASPCIHSHCHAPPCTPSTPMHPWNNLGTPCNPLHLFLVVFWFVCLFSGMLVWLFVFGLFVSLVFCFFVGLLVRLFVCLFAWVSVSIVYIVRVIVWLLVC